jgi:uncharacterized membrane protein YhaH (DUF805 family)
MTFKQAIASCFQKNYVGFVGRAPRSEYWFFVLFYLLALTGGGIVGFLLGGTTLAAAAAILVVLATFLPCLAAGVRRLHDTNSSGWWYLLAFVPYVGGVIMLVWFCVPGTRGENRFGHDPLQQDVAEVFG